METLAARYPEDDEAQIGYAIMLNISASPNDKSYADQLKGPQFLSPSSSGGPDIRELPTT